MQIETIDDFKRVGEDLFGYGWQTRLAAALGVDGSTVRRWVGSALPVPPNVTAYLAMMAQRQEARGRLAFYECPIGTAVDVRPAPAVVLSGMKQRFAFTQTEQLKPFPAISARLFDGAVEIEQDGGKEDKIAVEGALFLQVRHPDSYHLAGYCAAALARGFVTSVASHRHHHYTVVASRFDSQGAKRMIYTHAGIIRHQKDITSEPD
jgi:hypothetical protein